MGSATHERSETGGKRHPGAEKPGLPIGLIAGALARVVVLLLPLPASLPVAGQRMLAILAFAVVVWLAEAVSYEASAIIITSLMAFLVGTAPTIDDPSQLYGPSRAISMALAGVSNSALALVAGALFISAAMTVTGLDKRIAPVTLSLIGTTTRRILIGAVAVTIVSVTGYLLWLLFAATWRRWLGWV